jgi:hypothetical protein
MFSSPSTENKGPFYSGALFKRSFGKVSENLEFQINESFKVLKAIRIVLLFPSTAAV